MVEKKACTDSLVVELKLPIRYLLQARVRFPFGAFLFTFLSFSLQMDEKGREHLDFLEIGWIGACADAEGDFWGQGRRLWVLAYGRCPPGSVHSYDDIELKSTLGIDVTR
jgi:hypothetical protein